MEELQPEDIEGLLQELEEESGAQESLPQEVEELLHVLQAGTLYLARQEAAEQLGKVGISSSRIIRVLTAAQESDSYPEVRRAVAKSLRAPVHQEYLKRHPDLEETEKVKSSTLQPQEVELLLPILQSGTHYLAREAAAEQLGNVEMSSPRILRALAAAQESDPHPDVRRAAAKSLRAPVYQAYLQEHPDLMEATEGTLEQAPGKVESGQGMIDQQSRSLKGSLKASSVAGLAVGLMIGAWQAGQSLSPGGGLDLGAGFLVSLAAGAVVGAVVGAAMQGREDRAIGMIIGAIVAGVVASLSWFPILIWRVLQMGGP